MLPYEEATLAAMVHATVHEDVDPLRIVRPELDEALGQVVDRCVARRPEARFADGVAVARALLAFHGGLADR